MSMRFAIPDLPSWLKELLDKLSLGYKTEEGKYVVSPQAPYQPGADEPSYSPIPYFSLPSVEIFALCQWLLIIALVGRNTVSILGTLKTT